MTKARNWKKAAWITFFVLPGAAIVFIFILLPLFMSLFNSFFQLEPADPGASLSAGKLSEAVYRLSLSGTLYKCSG